MINMLVVEDDISQLIDLTNCITKSIPDIRVHSLVTTGGQALEIINAETIDLIILDLNLPDYSGIDILNEITCEYEDKYNDSVIIVSGDNKLINKIDNFSCIYSCIHKPYSSNKILDTVNSLIKKKNCEIQSSKVKEKIILELKNLNYNFSYNGTKYLIDCIYEAYIIGDIYNLNLKRDVYTIIAKKYNKSINNIKCNITQATNAMYYDCEERIIEEYFYTVKPKVKEVIFFILNRL